MNIYDAIPNDLTGEQVTNILCNERVRIKRILSKGHTAPAEGWFDQDDNEWVMVVEGAGTILFEDGTEQRLDNGDYLEIPAHTKHKVIWADPAFSDGLGTPDGGSDAPVTRGRAVW